MPDETGRAMDRGIFPSVRTRPGTASPLLRAMWADAVYDNPDWDALTFRRTADLAAINRVMPHLRADKTAIQPFIRAGNKAIVYQGWQDPSVNAGPTIDFYKALALANGGAARLGQSVRLFMYHCARGPGADQFGASGAAPPALPDPHQDMLWGLIRWREQGEAPNQFVATRLEDGKPKLTRLLCAFPQSARYDGKGEHDSAASFTCDNDPVLRKMLSSNSR
jgi:feruloyl esterase